jgi:hypothetical protein
MPSTIPRLDPASRNPLTNVGTQDLSKITYGISQFQYPDDLGNEDLKHYVLFNINVRGKSTLTLANETRSTTPVVRQDSAQLSEEQLGSLRTAALTLGGAGAGVAAGALVSEFKSSLFGKNQSTGGTGRIATAVKKVAPAAIGAGFGAGAAAFSDILKPDQTFRISDVIALYVDGPPTVRYATQYSNKELGTLAGIAAGGVSGIASALNPASEAGSAMAMKFAQIPQLAGVNTQDIIGASAKVALNPFKEVLFEAIDFRTFAFKYRFFPKSQKEADTVNEIIKRFKFHMHPELSSNKLFFIYPSEFEITYYFGGRENEYFHKLKPCVLESMDVTYGGEQFSSFSDGKPTEVNVSLTFRETEILTKQQIINGY